MLSFMPFLSRLSWKATEAPLLYFKAMRLIAALPTQEKKVVLPTFERGFYWAHSENILLAMLASQEADIRARGVAKIFAIRDAEKSSGDREKQGKGRKNQVVTTESTVRIFQTPKPVYTATCFTTMRDWKSEQVCAPPYVRDYTNEQIKQFETAPLVLSVPSNSQQAQHVERFIQLNTKVGTKASSSIARDGIVLARIENKREYSSMESKNDFCK